MIDDCQLKKTYENDSLHVIEDVENLMQNSKFLGQFSDISLKINESLKVRIY